MVNAFYFEANEEPFRSLWDTIFRMHVYPIYSEKAIQYPLFFICTCVKLWFGWRFLFQLFSLKNFRDINVARECETICGSEMFTCLENCGSNTECSSSCYRENIVCVDACPCHTGKKNKEWLFYDRLPIQFQFYLRLSTGL